MMNIIMTIKNNKFLVAFTSISIFLISYGLFIDYSNFIKPILKDHIGIGLSYSASLLGILFVILEVKARPTMFMVGIIGSFCSVLYLYFWSPLVWDLSIAVVYIILNIYGMYYWKHPNKSQQDQHHHITIKTLTVKEILIYTSLCIIGVTLLSVLGITWGRYSSPLQAISDAATTVISIIGQWFLAKKYLEMWYMWIIANALSIPLYMSINSYSYVMVYICYLTISFYGLNSWKQNILQENNKVFSK